MVASNNEHFAGVNEERFRLTTKGVVVAILCRNGLTYEQGLAAWDDLCKEFRARARELKQTADAGAVIFDDVGEVLPVERIPE